MKKQILTLTLAVTFLVAGNVRADVISVFTSTGSNPAPGQNQISVPGGIAGDRAAYMELAGGSMWQFVSESSGFTSETPFTQSFDLVNRATNETHHGGIVTLSNWSGNMTGTVFKQIDNGGTLGMSLAGNSVNNVTVTFGSDIQLSSFFIDQKTHSNGFDTLDITVTARDASGSKVVHVFKHQTDTWFGFIFDEGYYLQSIHYIVHGTNNTGLAANGIIGFGDGNPFTPPPAPGAVVPAPATLAVVALGLAGLGYVRTRRKK